MKFNFNKILLPFVYLYTFVPFALKILPSIQFAAYYIFMFVYIALNYRCALILLKDTFKNKDYIPLMFFLYLIVLFFSLFSPLIHNTYDISYFSAIVLGLFRNVFKVFFLLLYTYKITNDKEHLLYDFFENNIKAMTIYVFSTIMFIAVPFLKSFWRVLIYEAPGDIRAIEQINYFTRYGLSGFSGFRHTLQCTIAFIFNIVMFLSSNVGKQHNIVYGFILLMGNAFYGRVGLMVSLACLCWFVAYYIIKFKKIKLLLLIIFFFILGTTVFSILKTSYPLFDIWYKWSMAPVENLFKYGRIGTDSSDDMFRRMSFWPGWHTFFWGDGYYAGLKGGYYKNTDLGYMRPMLFYGVGPQFVAYLLPYLTLFLIFKRKKEYSLLAFLLGFQLFIFELKGEVFYIETGIIIGCYICLRCKNDKLLWRFK